MTLVVATLVASFLGSLQLGFVNAAVLRYALQKQGQSALWLSVGGSLPEIIYALAAGYLHRYFNTTFGDVLKGISLGVLFIYGFYLIFKKSRALNVATSSKQNSFLQGFILGLINPQLLVFWSVFLSLYAPSNLSFINLLGFAMAAAIGALACLCLFIGLSYRYSEIILRLMGGAHQLDKWLGGIILMAGVVSVVATWF